MEAKETSSAIRRESLIGLPVYNQETSRQIGTVLDFAISEDCRTIAGLYVTGAGWLKKGGCIPWQHIQSISTQAVIVHGEPLKEEATAAFNSTTDAASLIGRQILREDGLELGWISDILIHPANDRIAGVELSEGFMDDLIEGRRMLPLKNGDSCQGDVTIISTEEAGLIESYHKGIKNSFFSKLFL